MSFLDSFISNNILFEWSIAVSVVVAVVTATFVAMLLLTNFFTDANSSDKRQLLLDNLKSFVSSTLLQCFNIFLEMLRKITELPTVFLIIWNTILSNITLLLLMLILSTFSYFMFQFDTYVLMSLDSFYRCNVTPFVNNVLLSFLHMVTLIWGAFIPIFNFFFVLVRQIIVGSFLLASKCTLTTFTYFDYIIGWTEVFVEFLLKFLDFTGASSGFTAENNFFVNRFDIASVFSKFRELHTWVPSIFTCLCDQIDLVWNILFYPLQDPKVDQIVDHLGNLLISIGQVFVQIIPPFLKYPDFATAWIEVEDLIFVTGQFFDNWLLYTVKQIFEIGNSPIILESPDPFVFETASYAIVGTFNTLETLGNVTLHTLLPVDPNIPFSNYGIVWSLDKTFYNYNLFITYTAYLLHWVSRSAIELLESDKLISQCKNLQQNVCVNTIDGACSVQCTGLDDGSFIIKNMYPDCTKNPFGTVTNPKTGEKVSDVSFFNALACSVESLLKGSMNIFVVTYRLFLSFWWDVLPSIFEGGTPEENSEFFPIMRDHVGPWFSRDQNPKCFANALEVTRDNPSDLYCNNANLNEHVLFYFDRTGEYVWSLLEPTSFGKVGLYSTTKPLTEIIRILLRIVTSLDIFFSQDTPYFQQKMIAGYGSSNYPIPCDIPSNAIPTGVAFYIGQSQGSYNPPYQDEYSNLEVENWCNINVFEWIFIYIKRASIGFVRILDIFADGLLPNINTPDPCLEPGIITPVDIDYAPSINRASILNGYTRYTSPTDGEDESCQLEGVYTYKCSVGHLVTTGVDLTRDLIRSQVRNTLNLFTGAGYITDLSEDVCNLQKFEYSIASLVSSFTPFSPGNLQSQGIALIIYSLIDLFGSGAIIIQKMVTLLFDTGEGRRGNPMSFAAQMASSKTPDFAALGNELLVFGIELFYEVIKQFLDGLYLFSNKQAIFTDAKKIIKSIKDIFLVAKNWVFRIFALGMDFIGMFEGKVTVLEFIMGGDNAMSGKKDEGGLLKFIADVLGKITEQILKFVGLILNNLGDFGTIIKEIIAGICAASETLSDLTDGLFPAMECTKLFADLEIRDIKTEKEQEAKAIEESNSKAAAEASQKQDNNNGGGNNGGGRDYGGKPTFFDWAYDNFVGPNVRRRRLLSNKTQIKEHFPKSIYKAFKWNGESECDLIINAYKDYEPKSLTPLEDIQIIKCYEYRVLGREIKTIMPLVPEDIFYNWWAKYKFGYDMTRLIVIYISSLVKKESMVTLQKRLFSAGINANVALKFIRRIKKTVSTINFRVVFKQMREDMKEENTKKEYVESGAVKIMDAMDNIYTILTSREYKKHREMYDRSTHSVFHAFNMSNPLRLPTYEELFSNETKKHVTRLTDKNRQHPLLFGKVYTDMKCNPNSPVCLSCALVDNFIYSAFDAANVSASFYVNNYTKKVVPEFKQYWLNVTEYNIRYIKGSVISNTAFGSFEESYYLSDIYPSYKNFDFYSYATGLWEGTRSPFEIVDNIEYFFAGNYSGSIPSGTALMFGPTDLQFMLEWPFQQECTDAEFLYTSKIDRVGYGLWSVTGLYGSYFFTTRFITGNPPEPIGLVVTSLLPIASFMLYLMVVYQYNPLCLPSQNVWLIYDLLNYLEDFLFLDCFCSYVPFLSKVSCEQDTCDTCKIADFTKSTYYSCSDPNLVTGFNELPIIWHFVFIIRWFFTETFVYLEQLRIWPLTFIYEVDGIKLLLKDAQDNLPVSGVEEYCFYLHIGVPTSVIIALYMLVLCILPFVGFIFFYIKQVILLVTYLLISIYQLGRNLFSSLE